MSEVNFDNLNYEQFEVSVNNTMKEIQKAKRRQISKNKSLKARLIILTTTFFIFNIVIIVFGIATSFEKTAIYYPNISPTSTISWTTSRKRFAIYRTSHYSQATFGTHILNTKQIGHAYTYTEKKYHNSTVK